MPARQSRDNLANPQTEALKLKTENLETWGNLDTHKTYNKTYKTCKTWTPITHSFKPFIQTFQTWRTNLDTHYPLFSSVFSSGKLVFAPRMIFFNPSHILWGGEEENQGFRKRIWPEWSEIDRQGSVRKGDYVRRNVK